MGFLDWLYERERRRIDPTVISKFIEEARANSKNVINLYENFDGTLSNSPKEKK